MPQLQELGVGTPRPWTAWRLSMPAATSPGAISIWLAAAGFSGLVAVMLTRLAIGYAQRRALLDAPGRRRSHAVPTPRGGGVAIVGAMLAGTVSAVALTAAAAGLMRSWPAWLALVLVAAVGWLDDHREQGARLRLMVQLAAVMLVLLLDPFAGLWRGAVDVWSVPGLLASALLLMWFINLHNFMDGINGLLALHAIFVFLALGIVLGREPVLWVAASAVLGFLPFNFPRARIFMGDVGSGTLGLMVGLAVLGHAAAVPHPAAGIYAAMLLCSAFVVDASCTLASRMLRGRRWYSAHREHLYQWLVRSGFSHAQVVTMYMGWNLLVAMPAAVWLASSTRAVPVDSLRGWLSTAAGFHIFLATTLLGVLLWWLGKRWCLGHAHRKNHEPA